MYSNGFGPPPLKSVTFLFVLLPGNLRIADPAVTPLTPGFARQKPAILPKNGSIDHLNYSIIVVEECVREWSVNYI